MERLEGEELKVFALELAAAMPPSTNEDANQAWRRSNGAPGAHTALMAADDTYHTAMQNLIAMADLIQLASYSKEVINAGNLASMMDLMRRELSNVGNAVDILRTAAVGA